MVRRKPVSTGKDQTFNGVPYTETPLLSKGPSIEALGSPKKMEHWQNSTGSLDSSGSTSYMADTGEEWKDGQTTTKETRSELPPLFTFGKEWQSTDVATGGEALLPALQVGHPVNTPKSSFESQRSTRPEDQTATGQLLHGSNSPNAQSTNPYLRMKNTPYVLQDISFGGGNGGDIWGNAAKHVASATHKGQRSPDPFPEKSPFAEPWVQSTPVSVQQNPYSSSVLASNLNNGQEYPDVAAQQNFPVRPDGHGIQGSMSEVPEVFSNARHEDKPPISGGHSLARVGNPALPPSNVETNLPNSPGLREGPDAEKQTNAKKQKTESYQIRLVNWFDASSSINPRRSPIMVQNANGPCPLLALVNALTLSTPADLNTALVETLSVREQISLGLLLDAVIDELMSGRRGDTVQELPDVSDLYAFLITLHTGMNVNPMFVQPKMELNTSTEASNAGTSSSLHEYRKPGGFEDTREMKLYSAFAIPLIHGWIPPRNHSAFAALQRSANTYEDAQNLMFVEEELEDKLQRQGLNEDEQLKLEDIASIKYFLSSSATQLTGYGLDTVTDALLPGSIAILFRNDHFSTLYKHPRTGQLFTLVTDMGYAGHDEVVWESLADVSGEGCEFFAGDFRPVGNITASDYPESTGLASSDSAGWNTMSRSNNNRSRRSLLLEAQTNRGLSDPAKTLPDLPSLSLDETDTACKASNTEQEDHDLALAMQLQEEEEDRDRRETAARRRREDELSQAYLKTQEPSARRGPVRQERQEVRPLVPLRSATGSAKRPDTSEDVPPPTYEQASKGPAYHPPPDHPAHPYAPPAGQGISATTRGGRQRQSSAYTQNSTAFAGLPSTQNLDSTIPPTRGNTRRRSSAARFSNPARAGLPGGPGQVVEEDRRDCIVM